ncbi:helix-turn-helix domain-containing protein [Paenibacillus sp. NPDC057934]|uniref:helix-turn-helix domain-containing protein n=1 Tax=Paenibacillus sp. NPDC057934 TaxID=3346282 RepID=UPI0036DEE617
MLHPTPPTASLHSLLFQLSDVELRMHTAGTASQPPPAKQYTLLVFTSGTGELHAGDETVMLRTEACVLLSPGESLHICDNETTLYYYEVSFTSIYTSESKPPMAYSRRILTGRRELVAYPFSKLIRLVEDLYSDRTYTDEISRMKQNLKLQELLLFLFEYNFRSEDIESPTQSVERTIRYLQDHYMVNITVKQLSEIAGMSIWQYTPIFQNLTGSKPLEYLTDLRIHHSKQLLLHSGEPLREIARQVGYADEYYFNRRFRQRTGIAPGQYAHSHRPTRRVTDWTGHEVEIPDKPRRIIYHGETIGDLLALGIKPIGGEEAFSWNRVYKHRLKKLVNVGFPMDAEAADSLSPDLIILANANDQEYSRISAIAPTLSFDSFASLEKRLHLLGCWLGKESEAAAWLGSFSTKNAALWQRLRAEELVRPGETASVLIHDHGNRLFVMGCSGLAPALYAPGGFIPVDRIKEEILDQDLGFGEIEAGDMAAYTGDRLFMLIPEREDSRLAMEELLRSPEWTSLPAVQNGLVYLLDGAKWNAGDALTREKLLTWLPKLLQDPAPVSRLLQ